MGSELRIVIAGGGTGGHLYPGLALAEAFKARLAQAEIVFMGTARGIENRIVPEEGYQLVLLPVRGVLRRLALQNLLVPFNLAQSLLKSWKFFKQFKPHLVLGTGGYVAGPPLIVAKLMKIKTAIQEQNSYPGVVNRKLGDKVDAVFIAFEAARSYFGGQRQVHLTGNPIRLRPEAGLREQAAEAFSLDPAKRTIFVFGGSQGAKAINEAVAQSLNALLKDENLQLLWVAGSTGYDAFAGMMKPAKGRVRIVPYIRNMSLAYNLADLTICRAGAMTISELTLFGLPAIYVPYPYATADHQTHNARAVVEAGGGLLMPEKELTPERMVKAVRELLSNSDGLSKMAANARTLGRPDAAKEIVDACLSLPGLADIKEQTAHA